jgi:hypothetical protein
LGSADEPKVKPDETKAGKGSLISLRVTDAPIHDVLHLLSREAGIYIVFDRDEIKGTVTAQFTDKTVDLILKYLSEAKNLQYRMVGDVYILEPKSKQDSTSSAMKEAVYVTGEVRKPGIFKLKPGEQRRVLEWLAQAELLPSADLRRIELCRKEGQPSRVTALSLNLIEKKENNNVLVQPGDVLIVPKTGTRSGGLGAVPSPQRNTALEAELPALKTQRAVAQTQTDINVMSALADVDAARAALEQAEMELKIVEAEMQQQRATIAEAGARLKEAEESLREVKEKHKAGVATPAEVRQAETALATAKANVERLKATLAVAQARIGQGLKGRDTVRSKLALAQSLANRLNLPGVGVVSEAQLLTPVEPLRKPVSLSEKNAKLEEVIRKLSQQAGVPITLHESVPKDIQVSSATLYGVTLAEALHLLLQQAGLRAVPSEDRKGIVIVPPNRVELSGSTVSPYRGKVNLLSSGLAVTSPLSDLVTQHQQTGQSLVPMVSEVPTVPPWFGGGAAYTTGAPCSKCKTPLQSDWLFCPKCGAKNEKSQGKDWKFCPTCGKALTAKTSSSGTTPLKK